MVKLIHQLSLLKRNKILLVGDLMLDRYTFGKAKRISPEAPVPILNVKELKSLPGGAGNVALGLIALDQEVLLMGRVGDDDAGKELVQMLALSGVSSEAISIDPSFQTPIKNRLIAGNQQMLRIDHETITSLGIVLEDQIIASIPERLQGVKVVALSDYGKGFLSENVIQALIKEATFRSIPVLVDPKGADFSKYRSATLIKPNLKEAYEAAKCPQESSLESVAEKLLLESGIKSLMITRSEEGITLFEKHLRKDYPVSIKEVVDVTGAGDTVLAMLTSCIASDFDLDKAIPLCNVAASLSIEHVGCQQITTEELSRRLLEEHKEGKLIESFQASALYYALKDRPHTIFELTDETTLEPELYEKIRSLKTLPSHTIVMSVDTKVKSPSFVAMLTSLKEIDFILKK